MAVKRVKAGQGVGPVARELELVEQTRRNWVKAAERGQLNPPGAKIITAQQMELSWLRAANARLRMECEIQKGRRTPRKTRCEVRLDRWAATSLPAAGDVRDAVGQHQWVSGMEARQHAAPEAADGYTDAGADPGHPRRIQGRLWQPRNGRGTPW